MHYTISVNNKRTDKKHELNGLERKGPVQTWRLAWAAALPANIYKQTATFNNLLGRDKFS